MGPLSRHRAGCAHELSRLVCNHRNDREIVMARDRDSGAAVGEGGIDSFSNKKIKIQSSSIFPKSHL